MGVWEEGRGGEGGGVSFEDSFCIRAVGWGRSPAWRKPDQEGTRARQKWTPGRAELGFNPWTGWNPGFEPLGAESEAAFQIVYFCF